MPKGYVVTYKRTPKRKYDFAEAKAEAEKRAAHYRSLGYRRVTVAPVE